MPLCAIAGDSTVRERDGTGDAREIRGRVAVLVKPDDTVLVHDVDGYQPVAWLTRADGVAWERAATGDDPKSETTGDTTTGGDGTSPAFTLTARKDQRVLRVTGHEETAFVRYDATAAGLPVGDCRCGGSLVRADGRVRCLDCAETYGLPRDATVLDGDDSCGCGLPLFAVERGRRFELCLDRDCPASGPASQSMEEAVRSAYGREWACPECGADLRVLRRGGLILGCERYPDCDTGFALPTGTLAGDCDCGLPVFDTPSGQRCVDATCEATSGDPA